MLIISPIRSTKLNESSQVPAISKKAQFRTIGELFTQAVSPSLNRKPSEQSALFQMDAVSLPSSKIPVPSSFSIEVQINEHPPLSSSPEMIQDFSPHADIAQMNEPSIPSFESSCKDEIFSPLIQKESIENLFEIERFLKETIEISEKDDRDSSSNNADCVTIRIEPIDLK